MKTLLKIIFTISITLNSNFIFADEDKEKSKQEKDIEKTSESVIDTLNDKLTGLSSGDPRISLIKEAIFVVERIQKKTRINQNLVYLFTRTVNRNIDTMDEDKYREYKQSIYAITEKLREDTYDDSLFNNNNLTDVIQLRLPTLILDSQTVSDANDNDTSTLQYQKEFKDELNWFQKKYLSKKTFKFNIGGEYSYLPQINYAHRANVDVTPFIISEPVFASERPPRPPSRFPTGFSNFSYPSIVLSAEMPYLAIDVSVPIVDEEKSTVNSVRKIDLGGNSAFVRSTNTSNIVLEYDFQLRLSFRDLYVLTFIDDKDYSSKNFLNQIDFGMGTGILGLDLNDEVTTDLRLITSPTQTFNDLESSGAIKSSSSNNINVSYYSFFIKFEIDDTWSAGMTLKKYRSETESSGDINVDGQLLAFSLLYRFQ
jgi:hypothetical protein